MRSLGRHGFSSIRSGRAISSHPIRSFSTEAAAHPSSLTQVYLSRTRDPLLNLSVEHRLLQITPPESTVFLLYVNTPCVVLGRNQNPWLEANLARLAAIAQRPRSVAWEDGRVQLIRRRSGGGGVFHDSGNVNFCVICPPSRFHRNKHAEMVVRALRALGRHDTRVNERHDIVMDVPQEGGSYKISGSAYKLTRLRALHHGTCLLRSPNLASISGLLRSAAAPFIKAQGVESVRSPVRNADVGNEEFENAVVEEFRDMYGVFDVCEEPGDGCREVTEVRAGYEELRSRAWTYGQTPRFSFSSQAWRGDAEAAPALPFATNMQFEARHGQITHFTYEHEMRADAQPLIGALLHEITDWTERLAHAGLPGREAGLMGAWLNEVMGTQFTGIRPEQL